MDIADDWVLHHNNTPTQTALSIQEFLAKEKHSRTSTSSLQPRSSYVRFLPLLYIEIQVEGSSFGTVENAQKVVTAELHTLTENDFRYCYDKWKKRNHCVTSQGSYFEGDNF